MTLAGMSIPCLTATSSHRVAIPFVNRWIAGREKYSLQGIPTFQDLVDAAGVPGSSGILFKEQTHQCSGNMYHLANFACVMLAALLSCERLQAKPADIVAPEVVLEPLPAEVRYVKKRRCYVVKNIGSVPGADFYEGTLGKKEARDAAVKFVQDVQEGTEGFLKLTRADLQDLRWHRPTGQAIEPRTDRPTDRQTD